MKRFYDALKGGAVRHYASKNKTLFVIPYPEGQFALAIDPLDGSSTISDTNVSIGTIFGIYPAEEEIRTQFLRSGRDLLAAGPMRLWAANAPFIITNSHGV